jgi:hypothetical protein
MTAHIIKSLGEDGAPARNSKDMDGFMVEVVLLAHYFNAPCPALL